MVRYLRLLRLQDQYIQFGAALFAGVFAGVSSWNIIFWAVAVTFLSCSAFIVNEITDRNDCDKHSWNPVHSYTKDYLNPIIVWIIFVVTSECGLWLASFVGLFKWGLGIWIIGVLYSLEPVRFKRRFGFDIISQLLVWWILPFLAPVWTLVPVSVSLSFITIICFVVWSVFYPYQIADYTADRLSHLRSTHVVLGVYKSTQLGCWLGFVGCMLFFLFDFGNYVMSLLPIFVIQIAVFWLYIKWLVDGREEKILGSMQAYVRFIKPVGIFIPLYLFFYWRFVTL